MVTTDVVGNTGTRFLGGGMRGCHHPHFTIQSGKWKACARLNKKKEKQDEGENNCKNICVKVEILLPLYCQTNKTLIT